MAKKAITVEKEELKNNLRDYVIAVLKKPKKYLPIINNILNDEPLNGAFLLVRGIIYSSDKSTLYDAIKDYSTLIEIDPGSAVSYTSRGQCYKDLENYSEALKDFQKAHQLRPSNNTVLSLFDSYVENEKYSEAYNLALSFEHSLCEELSPGIYKLAQYFEANDEKRKALKLYELIRGLFIKVDGVYYGDTRDEIENIKDELHQEELDRYKSKRFTTQGDFNNFLVEMLEACRESRVDDKINLFALLIFYKRFNDIIISGELITGETKAVLPKNFTWESIKVLTPSKIYNTILKAINHFKSYEQFKNLDIDGYINKYPSKRDLRLIEICSPFLDKYYLNYDELVKSPG